MEIHILEDDLFQQQKLKSCIKEILIEEGWKCSKLETYSKAKKLLEEVKTSGIKQVYFLDIQIKNSEKEGLEIAQTIRNVDALATIIFVTTHSEFLRNTFQYKVSALDFISKDQDESGFKEQVKDCLRYVVEHDQTGNNDDVFVYDTPKASFQIPFSEIYYFETSDTIHKTVLVSKTRRIEFYAQMKEIEAMDDRFFRCHRAYIINPENVRKIDKEKREVFFDNQAVCIVSRKKLKALAELIRQGH